MGKHKKSTPQGHQLSLWGEPEPVIVHGLIEIIWLSGHREIYCTASPERPVERPGDWEWGSGFVGPATLPEDCPICNPKTQPKEQ